MWEIILGKRTGEIIGALPGDGKDIVVEESNMRKELFSVW